jgi:hypothetical protein
MLDCYSTDPNNGEPWIMATQKGTDWHLKGEELGSCNCDWGCPCQFSALPTHGNCEMMNAWFIEEGHFDDTQLNGVKFAHIVWWPGPMHEGEGHAQLILDDGASAGQRAALTELYGGDHGGPFFQFFAAVCPNQADPIVAPIALEMDREARVAHLKICGVMESDVEPIKLQVTGDEQRVQITQPGGFDFVTAEMGNSVAFRVHLDPPLKFEHENCYAQLAPIDWSGP